MLLRNITASNNVDRMITVRRDNTIEIEESVIFPTISMSPPWFWGFNSLNLEEKEAAIFLYNALKAEVNQRKLDRASYDFVSLKDIAGRLPLVCPVERLMQLRFHEWINITGFLALYGREEDVCARRLQFVDLEAQLAKPSYGDNSIIKGVCDEELRGKAIEHVRNALNNANEYPPTIHYEDLDLLEKLTCIKLSELETATFHIYLSTKKECEKIKEELYDSFQDTNIRSHECLGKQLEKQIWDERIRTFPLVMRRRLEKKEQGENVKFVPRLSYKKQIITYTKDPTLSLSADLFPPGSLSNDYRSLVYSGRFPPSNTGRNSLYRENQVNWSSDQLYQSGFTSYGASRNQRFIDESSPYSRNFVSGTQTLMSGFMQSGFSSTTNLPSSYLSHDVFERHAEYRGFSPLATSDLFDNSILNRTVNLSDTTNPNPVQYAHNNSFDGNDTSIGLASLSPPSSVDSHDGGTRSASVSPSIEVLPEVIPDHVCRFFAEIAAQALALQYPLPLRVDEVFSEIGELADFTKEDIIREEHFNRYFNIGNEQPNEISIKDLSICKQEFTALQAVIVKAERRICLAKKLANLLRDSINNAITYKFVNWLFEHEEFISLPHYYPQKFRLIDPDTVQLIH